MADNMFKFGFCEKSILNATAIAAISSDFWQLLPSKMADTVIAD